MCPQSCTANQRQYACLASIGANKSNSASTQRSHGTSRITSTFHLNHIAQRGAGKLRPPAGLSLLSVSKRSPVASIPRSCTLCDVWVALVFPPPVRDISTVHLRFNPNVHPPDQTIWLRFEEGIRSNNLVQVCRLYPPPQRVTSKVCRTSERKHACLVTTRHHNLNSEPCTIDPKPRNLNPEP